MHISTDIGGTFTDFVILDGEKLTTFKVPSTPQQPELAIKKGLADLSPATAFSHGATIATNAVLERKGSNISLITTRGFADILKIGRQQRSHLYKLDATRPKPLVDYYFEISERVSSKGEIITSPAEEEILAVAERIKTLKDEGGALRVGPESAGAVPAPLCYGLGGTDVTVTDSDLLCGFINPNYFLGGEMVLEARQAKSGVKKLAHELCLSYIDMILGVWKVMNSNMIKAIRLVSVEKGLDTRDFALIAFGGAGPVHAAALAKELSIPRVIVPFAPGVFSAYGIIASDVQLDYSVTNS